MKKKKRCANCDCQARGAMPHPQRPGLMRCQTVRIVKAVLFIGLLCSALRRSSRETLKESPGTWEKALCHCVSVSPVNLPESHMDSLIRIRTQGSTQTSWTNLCGQSLGICIFNRLSPKFLYKQVYENYYIYFTIFVLNFTDKFGCYCSYCVSSD